MESKSSIEEMINLIRKIANEEIDIRLNQFKKENLNSELFKKEIERLATLKNRSRGIVR